LTGITTEREDDEQQQRAQQHDDRDEHGQLGGDHACRAPTFAATSWMTISASSHPTTVSRRWRLQARASRTKREAGTGSVMSGRIRGAAPPDNRPTGDRRATKVEATVRLRSPVQRARAGLRCARCGRFAVASA
jgi:hypothetical protein